MNLPDDLGDRLDAKGLKTCFIENAGPGVENLHGIGAGLYLADQIGGGVVREQPEILGSSKVVAIPQSRAASITTGSPRRRYQMRTLTAEAA